MPITLSLVLHRQRTLGDAFDPKKNALNLIRLILALLVIFSHALTLGGYGSEFLWREVTLGDVAVNGFFAVSGFLIAASAMRNRASRYLWQRFLRIFPAFWVCLILTAVVAGPISWSAQGKQLRDYWSAPKGPLHYVASNFFLKIRDYAISGTPNDIPHEEAWNGSLWTLYFEFLCYLMILALAITTILQRRRIVLALGLSSWVFSLMISAANIDSVQINHLARFVPIFMAGSIVWLYRDKIPDSAAIAAICSLIFVAGTFMPNPDIVSGPPLAFLLVWAAIHMPGKRIGAKYDISYGAYIYAYLVAQLLATYGVHRSGYWPFTSLTVVLTLLLAAGSCLIVERPALRLKNWSPARMSKGKSALAVSVSDPDRRASDHPKATTTASSAQ